MLGTLYLVFLASWLYMLIQSSLWAQGAITGKKILRSHVFLTLTISDSCLLVISLIESSYSNNFFCRWKSAAWNIVFVLVHLRCPKIALFFNRKSFFKIAAELYHYLSRHFFYLYLRMWKLSLIEYCFLFILLSEWSAWGLLSIIGCFPTSLQHFHHLKSSF